MKMINCSIGICVYNEEANIAHLLDSLLAQRTKTIRIVEIVVIASGTTDRTIDIVSRYMKKSKRMRLLRERKRRGKASAVNMFIQDAQSDILVLVGGDLLLTPTTMQSLVGKFKNSEIGMTGARPIPVHMARATLATRSAALLWELHHRISLERPKMGEVVAFRRIFKRIPVLSSVDEANIEPLIRGQGYRIAYVPQARVHNKTPSTLREFVMQRRRIYAGHMAVKYEQSYEVSTYRTRTILRALAGIIRDDPSITMTMTIVMTILLEALSRLLGLWDYRIARRRHTVWDIIPSTKNPAL